MNRQRWIHEVKHIRGNVIRLVILFIGGIHPVNVPHAHVVSHFRFRQG